MRSTKPQIGMWSVWLAFTQTQEMKKKNNIKLVIIVKQKIVDKYNPSSANQESETMSNRQNPSSIAKIVKLYDVVGRHGVNY